MTPVIFHIGRRVFYILDFYLQVGGSKFWYAITAVREVNSIQNSHTSCWGKKDLWFYFIDVARIRKDHAAHIQTSSEYSSPILMSVNRNPVIFGIGRGAFGILAFSSTSRLAVNNFDPPSRPSEKSSWNNNMSFGENKDFGYYLIEVARIW